MGSEDRGNCQEALASFVPIGAKNARVFLKKSLVLIRTES